MAGVRRLARGNAGRVKQLRIQDHVIGREREHDGFGIALPRDHGSGGDGRRGIPALGLEHHGCFLAEFLRLAAGKEPEIADRHDDRGREQFWIGEPQQRLLERRAVAHDRHELLGHAVPRHRPEPRAGAAGEEHGNDTCLGHDPFRHAADFDARDTPRAARLACSPLP